MKNLPIKFKIITSFAVIMILLIVTGLITFKSFNSLSENENLAKHTYNVLSQIEIVYSSLKDAQLGERGYVLTGEKKYLDPYNSAIRMIPEQFTSLKQMVIDLNQKQRLDLLDTTLSNTLNDISEAIILREIKGFNAAQKYVATDKIKTGFDKIRKLMDELINYEKMLVEQRNSSTEKSSLASKTAIIGIVLVAFLIVVIMSYLLTKLIAGPIIKISAIADRIALGDLTTEVEIKQKDEIGQMGHSFNKMIRNLRNQINEISEGINVLASSSSEIMAAVTQLASGSAETVTSVGETTTTVEEIKQTAEISNQKAKLVTESIVKTTGISKEGNQSINKTIEGMNKIKTQMDSIASIVVKLSEQSQLIGEITSTVNELAEQSNLLAVNAAIEAAKAGEQGKGFSVVAQEIKNLSQRSKEATEQVRMILRDIQKSISSAVMVTEEGGRVVVEGIKLTIASGEVIKYLSENMSDAANAAIQISASSQQQLEGMDQIVSAMENIKESSIQSAASTQQSAESVTSLHKLGEKLSLLMDQYKL
jgi:methyl-accepting chemotaxis protein